MAQPWNKSKENDCINKWLLGWKNVHIKDLNNGLVQVLKKILWIFLPCLRKIFYKWHSHDSHTL